MSANEQFPMVLLTLLSIVQALALEMALAGAYIWISGDRGLVTMLALLATLVILVWQFYMTSVFRQRTVFYKSDPVVTKSQID